MKIKREGLIKFDAKMDVTCTTCGAKLEIDARDINRCSKASEQRFFEIKCDYCKRLFKVHESLILKDVYDEYDNDWELQFVNMVKKMKERD